MPATSDLRVTIPEGEVIAGKFRVEGIVGEGGLGFVYEATHLELDERVALKFLKPDMAARTDIVQRFGREARAVVKLKSEHVARVMDVGQHEGRPFIVMELLKGRDLGKLIHTSGAISVARICDYLIQACEALSEAHARGIVHRDIKPENLFLVDQGEWSLVKVLDFGISKVALTGEVSSVSLDNVQTASIVGSPYYLSPEQIRSSKDVDHRTDIWSLGVVAFELASGGAMPFVSTDFTALVAEIIERPHRALSTLAPDAPSAFVQIVNRCLAKEPEERFQSAAELSVALLPFAPKRSRAAVERATAMLRASGHGPVVALPNSLVPPAMVASNPTQTTVHEGPPSKDISLTATVPGPELSETSRQRWVYAVPFLLAALGVVAWSLRDSRLPPPATPVTSTAPPPVVPLPVMTVVPTASAPAATSAPPAVATAESAPTASVKAVVAVPTTKPASQVITAPAKPPPAPKPAGTDLEIRRER